MRWPERMSLITNLMEKTTSEMTADSRTEARDPYDPQSALMAGDIDQAFHTYDLDICFKPAMVMDLHADYALEQQQSLNGQKW